VNCRDSRLGAYLDGELGAQDRLAIEEHVASCAQCREELDELRVQGNGLRRALGGLLLHVDMGRLVMAQLPVKRRSLVMVRTQGVRRRMALAGFAVAAVFMIASFLRTGPSSVLNLLTEPQRAAFFLNWALALAAGSMLIWPEKIAWLESRLLAPFRGEALQVHPRERLLVQGVGLIFLCVSTAVHFFLMRNLGL
jgi:anti-sigma factor RsiW